MKKDLNELGNAWGNNEPGPTNADILRDSENVTARQDNPPRVDWQTWSDDGPKAAK